MRTGVFLDDYCDYVSSLPAELRRLLSTMRELDERSQAILIQLREQCRQCLNMPSQQSKKATPEQVEAIDKLRREIEDNQEKSLSLSMEKVLLAKQANEMVETHVKRLDEDLANFEEELKQGPSFHSRRHHDEGKLPLDSPMVLLSGDKRKGDFRAPPFKRPDMRGDREREREMDMDQALGAHRRKVQVEVEADQPVDPDEPKYCVCHQVSFGEMIACDNEDKTQVSSLGEGGKHVVEVKPWRAEMTRTDVFRHTLEGASCELLGT